MPTQITIPDEAIDLAKAQAAAKGFSSVPEYVADLIRKQDRTAIFAERAKAVQNLKELRQDLPKQSQQEIVAEVTASRADLR